VRKTSVYLPDQLKAQLTAFASRTHRSEADLVRAAVERLVDEGAPPGLRDNDPPIAGRLVGIGVGPGAADLLTVRALRALRRATVVLAPCTDALAMGRAEAIVHEAVPDITVERVVFAMVASKKARRTALNSAAARVVDLLDGGAEVAFVTLGDPNLYSTFSSVAERVAAARPDAPIVTVPGVMAFQELAARSGTVLADDEQSFLVLPAHDAGATDPEGALSAALRDGTRTVVIYKGGREIAAVTDRLREVDRLDGSVFGELLGLPGERIVPAATVFERPASYLSTVIVPARTDTP
jgi:precorrin-2/cobalt-factor-2 C20-methyltransferase